MHAHDTTHLFAPFPFNVLNVCPQVLLDGVDLRQLNVQWLRRQMGLVSQVSERASKESDAMYRCPALAIPLKLGVDCSRFRPDSSISSSIYAFSAIPLQEPTLFAVSIRENIALGAAHGLMAPTEEEVVAAAMAANAHGVSVRDACLRFLANFILQYCDSNTYGNSNLCLFFTLLFPHFSCSS